jgi:hypothetical protein
MWRCLASGSEIGGSEHYLPCSLVKVYREAWCKANALGLFAGGAGFESLSGHSYPDCFSWFSSVLPGDYLDNISVMLEHLLPNLFQFIYSTVQCCVICDTAFLNNQPERNRHFGVFGTFLRNGGKLVPDYTASHRTE